MWRESRLLLWSPLVIQHLKCHVRNASLLQNDRDVDTRNTTLQNARTKYQLGQKTFNLLEDQRVQVNLVDIPPLLQKVPKEEERSLVSEVRFVFRTLFYGEYQKHFGRGNWTIQEMVNHFRSSWILAEPKGCEVWRTEAVDDCHQTPLQRAQADHWFAWQRLNGVTRNLIKRVHEIPEQFVPSLYDIQENHPYLGGISLTSHAQNGTLYAVDLTDVAMDDETPEVPIALFTVWNEKLMPVAINTHTCHANGKVFTPSTVGTAESIRNWVNARIWFNMVDAQYHQSITHLGFTHMLMDGVSVSMHRNLSDRHPIYKLLLPHFQYMHIINKDALLTLIEPGGFVDEDMYFGHIHMLKLISILNKKWTYEKNGSIRSSLNLREANEIPGYFFKDDALRLHGAIQQYVSEYTTHYYRNSDLNVLSDQEIQAFREELVRPRSMNEGGGCGMNGIPEFDNLENLVDVLTNFIYICSVEHSATNFPQYDQYAFPPNFAATLHGHPSDVVIGLNASMPNGKEFFSAISVMKILTLVLTNSLGNYKCTYLKSMDMDGRIFVKNFQQNLKDIRKEIYDRNADIIKRNNKNQVQEYTYEWLLPDRVLNSISI